MKKELNNTNKKMNNYICRNMDRLISISEDLVANVSGHFTRFLYDKVSVNEKLTAIVGGRGLGNTSFLLQCMKRKLGSEDKGLYVNLDDFYFSYVPLLDFVLEFYTKGGTHLFLDDLHKLPGADQDIKVISEEFPNLRIIFSSTSLGGNSSFNNLKNNPSVHFLPGLSFREYLELRYQLVFPLINFDDLLELNRNPGIGVLNRIRPLQYFDEYLREGYYPIAHTSTSDYQNKLMKILNQILEGDLSALHHIDYNSVRKIRIVLSSLAKNGPEKPNIERIAKEASTTRDSLLKFFKFLHQAGLINMIAGEGEKINFHSKPDRLYLNNSNLVEAISPGYCRKEDILETFLLNQLQYAHLVQLSDDGGFLVDGKYRFQLSWQRKTSTRVGRPTDDYTIVEGLEYQTGTKIPLWMFGFLY